MNGLKKCPFCGGEASLWTNRRRKYPYGRFSYAKCDICGAQTRTVNYMSADSDNVDWNDTSFDIAVDLWNERKMENG